MAEQVLRAGFALPRVESAPRARSSFVENLIITIIAVLVTTALFIALAPGCRHPFVVPLSACGVIVGIDVVRWLRGQLDTFDPKALISMLMLHATYFAPLLHQAWEAYTKDWAAQITDGYPRYFTTYGWVSLMGVCAYQLLQRFAFRRARPSPTQWILDDGRFGSLLAVAVGVSMVAAVVVITKFGGLRREEHQQLLALGSGLQHLSWLLMLSDPLPILLSMAGVRMLTDPRRPKSMFTVILLITGMAALAFAFLGLRGSRSAFMYLLVIVAGMAHYRIRRISVPWALGGGLILIVFVYYYGFFKRLGAMGADAVGSTVAAIGSAEQRRYLEQRTGNTMATTLLGDMSRAEMQTFMLYRLDAHGDRYEYRWGRTYLRSAIMIIPRAIWYEKGPGKNEAGTDLQYGQGVSLDPKRLSTRVYGLAGEAILNFGLLGVPLAFAAYGSVLGWYRRKVASWRFGDARYFLAPLFMIIAMAAYIGDSDNVMYSLLKNGTIPIAVVVLSVNRARLAPAAAPARP